MDQFPILKSDRLVLRQFKSDDLQMVYNGLSDPKVIRYYGISFDTVEATKAQMEWFANLEQAETGIWWVVTGSGDQFLGAGGFHDWNHTHRSAELGFWLLPQFWGGGIMQEAMHLILKYAFESMNLNRIYGYVESHNDNCRRALKRLDFTHEGSMKQCEWKDGKFIDIEIWAKLNTS